MSAQVSREIRLKARPTGLPTKDDFELASVELKAPAEGEVQVRNLWMSVDPYMRARMIDRPSYVPPFQLGQPLQGAAVGEVVASRYPAFKSGDIVRSMFGWRESFNAPAKVIEKIDLRGLPMQTFLGAAGGPGLAAYVGLLKIAELKDGDVVFVSAASGAVGSIVCQIAKIKGHTVIASTGGTDKCVYLEELGVDHIIDYKATKDIPAALRNAAPHGIDVYFDNVGGAHLEAAIEVARPFARFALCGMISQYNGEAPAGPRNILLAVSKSLTLKGFVINDHFQLMGELANQIAVWFAAGKLNARESVAEGIDSAPEAFLKLFSGDKIGKMLVRLG
jgi:NADPH-dependent curcumin reductase CurA